MIFLEIYQDCCNRFLKRRRSKLQDSKPKWWTSKISGLRRQKYHQFIQIKASKFKSASKLKQYHQTCSQLDKEIRTAVRNYERELALASKLKPKLLYAHLNKKVKPKDTVAALKGPDDQLIVDRDSICNHLNEYFHSVFERPTSSEYAEQFSENFAKRSDHVMDWDGDIEIAESTVQSKLANLDPAKAPGVDGVSNAVLRNCYKSWSVPLTLIFRRSIAEQSVPREWREANITPLFKKGSRTSTGNYRPVSLTSAVCKVLESIVKDSLMLHLETFDLLSSKQHGFVRKRACVTNLLETIDYRTKCFEEKQPVDIIYLDFAKAFDKVSHQLLLVKLKAYGVSETLTRWISSYLSERRQRVVLADAVSDWMDVTSGVPQGSVLGPCLFIIFINDLPSIVHSNAKLYADDCKLLGVVSSNEQARVLQDDLDRISSWASSNNSFFNESKCVVMHQEPDNPNFNYNLNGHLLETSAKERDLGIMVTSNLSSAEQVKSAVATANSILYRIKNSFSFIDISMANVLYKTFVRPHLEFAIAAWNPYAQTDIDKLERVQRKASKLPNCLRSQPYGARLDALKWTSLELRRTRGDLIQWHKIVHGHETISFVRGNQRLASHGMDSPAGNTRRGALGIERELVRNCLPRYNFFTNRVSRAWNKLSARAKSEPDTNSFKAHIYKDLNLL